MGVGNELYCWWESMWIGDKCFWYYDEVVKWSEEEPTACVVLYGCGVDFNLQRVLGSSVGGE